MTPIRTVTAAALLLGGPGLALAALDLPPLHLPGPPSSQSGPPGRAVVGVLPSGQAAMPSRQGAYPPPTYPGAPGGPSGYGPSDYDASGQLPAGQIPRPGGIPGTEPGPAPPTPSPIDGGTDIPPPGAVGAGEGAPGELSPDNLPPLSEPGTGTGADTPAPPFDPGAAGAPDLGGGLDAGALSAAEQAAGLGSNLSFAAPEVMGDSPGVSILQRFPGRPNPPPIPPRPPVPPVPPVPPSDVRGVALVPSIRSIKMSENQSPVPTDRILYGFNYFNNVNYSINQRFRAPIRNIEVYRHILGFEKTFFDGATSIGVRFPINTITADSPLPGIGGTSTAINTTNVFFKWAFSRNEWEGGGRLFSTGMAIGIPTGPDRFAGANYLDPFGATVLQPFLGSLFYGERWFLQGFSFLEVPMDTNLPTILFNGYALGYYVYKDPERRGFLTGVAPLFEAHLTTPLSHRGVRLEDPFSVPDVLNFTYGVSWEFGKRTRLLTGITTPVTGPRPFDFEAQCLLNIFF